MIELKNRHIGFQVTVTDFEAFKKVAHKQGLRVSELLRKLMEQELAKQGK